MHLRVLGNAGGSAPGRQLSSYLIDERFAIDAGSLTTALDKDEQAAVEAVALTHGHLDHVWTLPMFLIHRLGRDLPACHVIASAYTLETVHTHLFNDRIWVDLETAQADDARNVRWHTLEPESSQRVLDAYDVTAIALHHAVPSQGYLIRSGDGAVIVCGDTITTDRLWTVANETEDLRAIFVECAWPQELEEIAIASRHFAPDLFLADLAKLETDVPVHVTHRKPPYEATIEAQLRAAGDERLRFVEDGDVFDL